MRKLLGASEVNNNMRNSELLLGIQRNTIITELSNSTVLKDSV